jgi:hypothetical protein
MLRFGDEAVNKYSIYGGQNPSIGGHFQAKVAEDDRKYWGSYLGNFSKPLFSS